MTPATDKPLVLKLTNLHISQHNISTWPSSTPRLLSTPPLCSYPAIIVYDKHVEIETHSALVSAFFFFKNHQGDGPQGTTTPAPHPITIVNNDLRSSTAPTIRRTTRVQWQGNLRLFECRIGHPGLGDADSCPWAGFYYLHCMWIRPLPDPLCHWPGICLGHPR